MSIPFIDLKAQYRQVEDAVKKVLMVFWNMEPM